MINHEPESFRLEGILIYIKADLVLRSFERAALIACTVIVTLK